MIARHLLQHFDRLAEAPDASSQLRRFILDLAIRGRLVERDPGDEPVAQLLKRLRATSSPHQPFRIPSHWAWVSLAQLSDSRLGKMLDAAKNKGIPRPYLRNVNVRWYDFDLSDVQQMRFADEELEEFALWAGDVLVCEGGEPGRAAVWDERVPGIYFQKAIHRVRFPAGFAPKYFVHVLRAAALDGRLKDSLTGLTIKHLTGKGLAGFLVPLPPLAEQHRIVAKVDQLTALCDRLEAALATRDRTRTRLLGAVLYETLNADDPGIYVPATEIVPETEATPEATVASPRLV